MIPLKDDNPTRTFPVITLLIIAMNALVFFYMLSLKEVARGNLVNLYGVIPYELMHVVKPHMGIPVAIMVTVITSMFLHGGFFHLASNMLYLWIFGNNVEDSIGHLRFIFFYAICGVLAVFVHAVVNHESMLPMIGASGAISGILGGYMILFPRAKVLTLLPLGFYIQIVKIPAIFVLGFWIVVQIVNGAFSVGRNEGGVAWFAHIGGFLVGVLLIGFFKKGDRRRISY